MTPLKSKQSNRYSNHNQKVTSSINENKQKLNDIIANAQQLTYPQVAPKDQILSANQRRERSNSKFVEKFNDKLNRKTTSQLS